MKVLTRNYRWIYSLCIEDGWYASNLIGNVFSSSDGKKINHSKHSCHATPLDGWLYTCLSSFCTHISFKRIYKTETSKSVSTGISMRAGLSFSGLDMWRKMGGWRGCLDEQGLSRHSVQRLHHLRVINLNTLDPSWLAISANRQFTYLKESCHLEISRVLRLFCTEKHYKLGHSTVASSCSNLVRLCQFPCQLLQTHYQFIWPLYRVQSRGKTSSAWKV